MFLRLEVLHLAQPRRHHPDPEAQVLAVVTETQRRRARHESDVDAELFHQLTTERSVGRLPVLDVTTREVPHVRVPRSGRTAMAEQHLIEAHERCRNDVVGTHVPMMLAGANLAGSQHADVLGSAALEWEGS